MTTPQINKLRELKVGDRFYAASDKRKVKEIFEVRGPNEFSLYYASAIRRCVNVSKKIFVNKASRLEVVKTFN